MGDNGDFELETVIISKLKAHPRNYRQHPDDQLEHIIESIKEHGLYRNIVIARDGTILAGHGVVKAASKMGMEQVPVIRLDVDPDSPRALKVLTGDNEISHLGEIDDRMLTEILKEIKDVDIDGLLGTGFDEIMLANLVFVTRPESEIADFDAAAHWVGMPGYEAVKEPLKVIVNFRNETDRIRFMQGINATVINKKSGKQAGQTWSIWWPEKEKGDTFSLQFEDRNSA